MEAKERLKALIIEMRGDQGLRAFARLVGVSPGAMHNWQEGVNQPDKNGLQKLARVKGCTVDELQAYLKGEALPTTADISMPALREAIKKLSLSEALEIGRLALSRAENYTNNNILLLERNGNVKSFLKGDNNMTIAQLLQKFIASTPAPRLEQLLQELDYSREWLEALAAGTQPSDNDLDQIGLLLDSAEFTDDEGNAYFIERLEMMRGAPLDCRHHHAPNETVS